MPTSRQRSDPCIIYSLLVAMSATAFKNAVRRREHYERSQPAARGKLGLLEKHKDYVKRAKNFHEKEKRIEALRRKAEFRNPDEFYFKMTSTATKVGSTMHVHGAWVEAGTLQWHHSRPPNYRLQCLTYTPPMPMCCRAAFTRRRPPTRSWTRRC
jgi:hypothetical protein